MLEGALELDVGYCDPRGATAATMYVLRLAVRVEEYVLYLERLSSEHEEPGVRGRRAGGKSKGRAGPFARPGTQTGSASNGGASLAIRIYVGGRSRVKPLESVFPEPSRLTLIHQVPSCAAPELGGFARLLGERISITSEARQQLQRGRLALREKLDGAASSILRSWFARAVREQRVDVACAVRAHMAYLHRNLAPGELDQRAVATLLVSQVYLSTNFEGFSALEPVRDMGSGRSRRRAPSEAEAEFDANSRNSLLFDPIEVCRLPVTSPAHRHRRCLPCA